MKMIYSSVVVEFIQHLLSTFQTWMFGRSLVQGVNQSVLHVDFVEERFHLVETLAILIAQCQIAHHIVEFSAMLVGPDFDLGQMFVEFETMHAGIVQDLLALLLC